MAQRVWKSHFLNGCLSTRASDGNPPRAMPSGNKIASPCALLLLNKFFPSQNRGEINKYCGCVNSAFFFKFAPRGERRVEDEEGLFFFLRDICSLF